jgi:polyisoprenyl-phosphate glycosyltransferase
MNDYSVIIPVFRAGNTLVKLFEQCKEVFNKLNVKYELIFVLDSNNDESWNVIKNLKNEYKDNIKGIALSRNFGQHNAVICGIKYSSGVFILTMDEDLQQSPNDIPYLIEKQKEKDYDVVYGEFRYQKNKFYRNITSRSLKLLLRVGIPDLNYHYSTYRLIKSNIAKNLLSMNNSYTFLDGFLSWITTNTAYVYVENHKSEAGKSSYSLKKLIDHSINIFFTFSRFPIRLISISSFLLFIISISYSLYIFFRKIFYNDLITGFASVIVILGFGFGFTLLGISVLGEYLFRINTKTTNKPNFLEKEVI